MKIPCSTPPVVCVPGTDGDDPTIGNASIETPDVRMFFGYRYQLRSSNFCEATTQEAADLCALNPPDPFSNDIIYSSNEQTCTVDCSGTPVAYTIQAGAALGFSQAAADAAAYALACTYAAIVCGGGTPTLVANEAQACSVTCSDGSVQTANIPAGALLGLSLAEANAAAYSIACQAAATQCPDNPPPTFGNAATSSTSDCPTGGSFTFNVAANTFFGSSQGAANATAQSFADQQAVLQRLCLSDIATSSCKSEFYSDLITIGSEAGSSFTWSLTSGSLPPGMTFDNGTVDGTPSVSGTYSFTIQAVQISTGNISVRTYSFGVIEITTATPLTSGGTGTPYSLALAANGILSTASYSMAYGTTLPAGLSMSSAGVISGTPTTAGSTNFSIVVTDVNSGWTCTKDFSITIAFNPFEWWKLVNMVGSINGYTLTPSAGVVLGVAGKFGTGIGLSSTGGGADNQVFTASPITGLAYTGNGIDAFVWLKTPAGVNGHAVFTLQFTDSSGTVVWSMSFDFHVTVGVTYNLTPGGTSGNQVLAGSAAYRLFELWYDPVSKFIGIRVDDGAVLDVSSSPIGTAQAATAKGSISLLYNRITPGIGEIDACEMTVYPAVLTAPQRAALYAGGAGTTWPLILP